MSYKPYPGQRVRTIDRGLGMRASSEEERRHEISAPMLMDDYPSRWVGITDCSGNWQGWFNYQAALLPFDHPKPCAECSDVFFNTKDYLCKSCRDILEAK